MTDQFEEYQETVDELIAAVAAWKEVSRDDEPEFAVRVIAASDRLEELSGHSSDATERLADH